LSQKRKLVGEESEFGKNLHMFDASEKEKVDPPIGEEILLSQKEYNYFRGNQKS
jgi:hypothetical protein